MHDSKRDFEEIMKKKSAATGGSVRNSRPSEDPSARFEWWLVASLGIVAFLAFIQTVPYQFVYDDDWQVLRNPWIRDWSHVRQFFTTDVWRFAAVGGVSNYYRPFHMVAHAIGHSLTGDNPQGYHLFSILLHCACTILVAFLGLRLSNNKWAGAAGGLIFALHPAHAESVAWIAAVTDPLCALFYFGALYWHLKGDETRRHQTSDILTALLFLCALFSKEMAFTFPIVAAWLDYCLGRKFRWPRYALLAGVFALYAVLRVNALSALFIKQLPIELNLHERSLSSVVLAAQYVTKVFFPYDLNAFHVFHPTMGVLDPQFVLGALVLLLYGAAAWWVRDDRKLLFLLGFVFLTLLPALNIEGVGENVFADRYVYIPSLGGALLIPLVAGRLWRARPAWISVSGPVIASISMALLLGAYICVLWNTTFMWRDTHTLYTETLQRSPEATAIAVNLAGYYFERGEYDAAEKWSLRATKLYAKSFVKLGNKMIPVYTSLGALCLQRNQPAKALEYFQAAYTLNPGDFDTLQSIGSTYAAIGDYDKAHRFYEAALAVNPHSEVTYNNLACVCLATKDYDQVIEYARKALEISPRYAEGYLNLAEAHAAKGMKSIARQEYLDARMLNPTLAPAIDELLKDLDAPPRMK